MEIHTVMTGSVVCVTTVFFPRSRSTGKERDAESGLDYFGARYYASTMGRWLSPDWSAQPEDVPYSDLENPQSLNLYGYVNNNPLSKVDKDGHCGEDACIIEGGTALVVLGIATVAATEAVLSTPAGQRSLDTFTSAAGASVSNSISSIKNFFSKSDKPAPAAPADDKTGPKAATAPGVTAGGQATDQYGNKVGPSGKPQVDQVDHSSKKGANAARNEGKGAPEKHPSPTKGDPHYHPTDANGEKVPNSTHHNYPN